MNIGIFGDCHLGHSGTDFWHNRLLFDHAEEVVRETIVHLKKQSLDMVVILGDLTNNGTEEQLKQADRILSELPMPWHVVPGNHDRDGVRSGLFDSIFAGHIPGILMEEAGCLFLFLREYLPPVEYPKTELGEEAVEKAVGLLQGRTVENLFVFSHFPLIAQAGYAERYKANYAKHFCDGDELLIRLARLVSGRIISFSAHQHWHRIVTDEVFLHCMTASMIEYPMEARVVSIEDGALTVTTLPSARPESALNSLVSAEWVRGEEGDRERRITL